MRVLSTKKHPIKKNTMQVFFKGASKKIALIKCVDTQHNAVKTVWKLHLFLSSQSVKIGQKASKNVGTTWQTDHDKVKAKGTEIRDTAKKEERDAVGFRFAMTKEEQKWSEKGCGNCRPSAGWSKRRDEQETGKLHFFLPSSWCFLWWKCQLFNHSWKWRQTRSQACDCLTQKVNLIIRFRCDQMRRSCWPWVIDKLPGNVFFSP